MLYNYVDWMRLGIGVLIVNDKVIVVVRVICDSSKYCVGDDWQIVWSMDCIW